MIKNVTRDFASACSKDQLHQMLHSLFNQLADKTLDQTARRCCHASIDVCRKQLARPSG